MKPGSPVVNPVADTCVPSTIPERRIVARRRACRFQVAVYADRDLPGQDLSTHAVPGIAIINLTREARVSAP